MIAIFLWSTVVTQLNVPVVACGRSRILIAALGRVNDRGGVFDSCHLPTHSEGGFGFVAVLVSRKHAIFCASAWVMAARR